MGSESMRVWRLARAFGLLLCDCAKGEFQWSQRLQGPAFWRSVWSENNSFDGFQERNTWHWSCSIRTDSIIHLEMHITFINDTKKRQGEYFDFLGHYIRRAIYSSLCLVWFVVSKYIWVSDYGSKRWECRWIIKLKNFQICKWRKKINWRRNLGQTKWIVICFKKLSWTVICVTACFGDHSKRSRADV